MRICRFVLATILFIWSAPAPALAQTTVSASSADWIVQGDQPMANFGSHLAPAGDVDGDGYDDVLVGDSGYDGALTDSGRILLYRGSSTGLSQVPAWTLEGSSAGAFLSKAVAAGDVNGEGFAEFHLAVEYPNTDPSRLALLIYAGSPTGYSSVPLLSVEPDPPSHEFGAAASSAGDVNGDGLGDFIVDEPRFLTSGLQPVGRVYAFYGRPAF